MTAPRARVAIVDVDPAIRHAISMCLSDEEFDVDQAACGRDLTDLVHRRAPDVVLMEQNLGGEDGLALTRDLRQSHPGMGIIIVSGKQDIVDRVMGLEVGADDYVAKPFHERELLARVRSVWRRCGVANEQPIVRDASAADSVCRFAGWTLDGESRTLMSPDGEPVELTGGMFDLLAVFAARPNRVLSREQLKDLVGSPAAASFDRSIDVQVGRLRRRIERDPKRPSILKTVRNMGYMLAADNAPRMSACA